MFYYGSEINRCPGSDALSIFLFPRQTASWNPARFCGSSRNRNLSSAAPSISGSEKFHEEQRFPTGNETTASILRQPGHFHERLPCLALAACQQLFLPARRRSFLLQYPAATEAVYVCASNIYRFQGEKEFMKIFNVGRNVLWWWWNVCRKIIKMKFWILDQTLWFFNEQKANTFVLSDTIDL